MNDPEIWALIGAFAAAVLGGLTLVVNSLSRVIRAEVGGLRAELRAEVGGLRSELGGEIAGLRGELGGELAGLRHEVAAVNTRLDHLDRDVQALTKRVWGAESDS
ncbi:hypothetical protein GCM10028798_08770 [Humibacter antri]